MILAFVLHHSRIFAGPKGNSPISSYIDCMEQQPNVLACTRTYGQEGGEPVGELPAGGDLHGANAGPAGRLLSGPGQGTSVGPV
jgi:hypothetical protein